MLFLSPLSLHGADRATMIFFFGGLHRACACVILYATLIYCAARMDVLAPLNTYIFPGAGPDSRPWTVKAGFYEQFEEIRERASEKRLCAPALQLDGGRARVDLELPRARLTFPSCIERDDGQRGRWTAPISLRSFSSRAGIRRVFIHPG